MAEQISGPGKYAQRTDMNTSKQPVRYMAGGNYGEGQALLQQQQGADMAGKPTAARIPTAADVQRAMMGKLTPLTAMTERPMEPSTQGSRVGPGTDFSSLDLPMKETPTIEQVLAEVMKFDPSGETAAAYNTIIGA
jgi:hypothetical protein